ncbi:hypothetical protein D3C75_657710 [compost metagenome]
MIGSPPVPFRRLRIIPLYALPALAGFTQQAHGSGIPAFRRFQKPFRSQLEILLHTLPQPVALPNQIKRRLILLPAAFQRNLESPAV